MMCACCTAKKGERQRAGPPGGGEGFLQLDMNIRQTGSSPARVATVCDGGGGTIRRVLPVTPPLAMLVFCRQILQHTSELLLGLTHPLATDIPHVAAEISRSGWQCARAAAEHVEVRLILSPSHHVARNPHNLQVTPCLLSRLVSMDVSRVTQHAVIIDSRKQADRKEQQTQYI